MDSMLFVGLGTLKTPLRADILTGMVRFWHCAADATEDKAAREVMAKKLAISVDLAMDIAWESGVNPRAGFWRPVPDFIVAKFTHQQLEAADRTMTQAPWCKGCPDVPFCKGIYRCTEGLVPVACRPKNRASPGINAESDKSITEVKLPHLK